MDGLEPFVCSFSWLWKEKVTLLLQRATTLHSAERDIITDLLKAAESMFHWSKNQTYQRSNDGQSASLILMDNFRKASDQTSNTAGLSACGKIEWEISNAVVKLYACTQMQHFQESTHMNTLNGHICLVKRKFSQFSLKLKSRKSVHTHWVFSDFVILQSQASIKSIVIFTWHYCEVEGQILLGLLTRWTFERVSNRQPLKESHKKFNLKVP